MSRFTWTAPDGRRHQAGREVNAHVYRQVGGDDSMGTRDCDEDSDCRDRHGGVCKSESVPAGYRNYVCVYDECQKHPDCGPRAICVPPGIWYETARCIPASCRKNSDCALRAGGHCRFLLGRFGCVYRDDPCDVDRPCPTKPDNYGRIRRHQCALTDDGSTCVPRPEGPP